MEANGREMASVRRNGEERQLGGDASRAKPAPETRARLGPSLAVSEGLFPSPLAPFEARSGPFWCCRNSGASVRAQVLLLGDTEMRTFTIAAIIALLTMPAYAQGGFGGKGSPKPGAKTDQEKAEEAKQRKLDEKAYKDSVSRIPDRDQKTDPWAKIR